MLLKQAIIIIYLLTGFFLVLSGCQYLESKTRPLRLDPPLNKIYKYSLIKTWESYNKSSASTPSFRDAKNNNMDTLKLKFSLENTNLHDSLITYKLTFIDFFKNKKLTITYRITGLLQPLSFKDPFALYDSISYFIRGRSLQVVANRKGVVKEVTGGDELIKFISGISKESERHVSTMISDYLSNNALKDIMNRFLSAVPGLKVKEGDKWVRNITLITKAPVKLSNLYVFDQHNNDTASVSIQSIISAEQSEGGNVYMKGKGKGIAIINYVTGMPYLFETGSETETTTTQKQYEYISKEHFLVKEYN